jgi:hypothetical protein
LLTGVQVLEPRGFVTSAMQKVSGLAEAGSAPVREPPVKLMAAGLHRLVGMQLEIAGQVMIHECVPIVCGDGRLSFMEKHDGD